MLFNSFLVARYNFDNDEREFSQVNKIINNLPIKCFEDKRMGTNYKPITESTVRTSALAAIEMQKWAVVKSIEHICWNLIFKPSCKQEPCDYSDVPLEFICHEVDEEILELVQESQ